jgi:hypothetical protein
MRRKAVALGILGLICAAALPAGAQGQIKIFGQNYAVVNQTAVNVLGQRYFWNGFGPVSRAQTYKNGVTIHRDNDLNGVGSNSYASVYFSEGATAAEDRLWFAARIYNNADATGDQLYYLQGADANGMFTPSVSDATTFFGGNVDREHGGRMISAIELNRDDTGGVGKDRNVLACTFWDDDALRIYDLDSMSNDRMTDALFTVLKPGQAVSSGDAGSLMDDNLPVGGEPSFAHLPTPDGHTVLVASGPGANGETGISIWDTTKDAALPVLTDVTGQTKTSAKPFPQDDGSGGNLQCVKIMRYGDQGEYWFLLMNPEPGDSANNPPTAMVLVRAMLEIPADLATAKAGDIKVTVLDTQDLNATAADILFRDGSGGITGITAGRPFVTDGPRVLYTTDFEGNFYQLIPTS